MSRFFLLFLVFIACSESKKEPAQQSKQDSSLVQKNNLVQENKVWYSQFILDTKGKTIDSFPDASPFTSRLMAGTKQNFPSGFAAFQQHLTDSLLCGCNWHTGYFAEWVQNDDTTYGKNLQKLPEQFKPTEGESVFTKNNCKNYYFFLTQIDSVDLFVNDAQYGLLHFLKLKTHQQQLKFKVKHYKEEFVNTCAMMKIAWDQPFIFHILEDGRQYSSSFTEWTEAWQCGQKADYAPVYPYLNPKNVKGLVKEFQGDKEDIFKRWIISPTYVFSYLCFDDQKNEWEAIKTKSYDMQLVTIQGKVRKGRGLDFNNDKKADVFWYHLVYNENVSPERVTVLYLKVEGQWIPFYHVFKNEFM